MTRPRPLNIATPRRAERARKPTKSPTTRQRTGRRRQPLNRVADGGWGKASGGEGGSIVTSTPYLKLGDFLFLPRFSHIFSHTGNRNLPDYLERLHTSGQIYQPPSRRRLREGQFWPPPASRPTKVNGDVSNSNTIPKTMSGLSTGCSASTTSAGALLHPNRYSTKVVASINVLTKRREATTWVEESPG